MTGIVETVTIYLPCGGRARLIDPAQGMYECDTCECRGFAGTEDNPCGMERIKYKQWEERGNDYEWVEDGDNREV